MNKDDQLKKILDFIKNEHICVMSTVSESGTPQSAVMAFSETPDLRLIVGTSNTTRKYKNLTLNSNVAAVIGWDLEKFITVQYEGTAHEAEGEEIGWARELLTSKNEESKKFADSPDNRYFVITPGWVRYWEIKGKEKFELTF
jgi:general stress protein 26